MQAHAFGPAHGTPSVSEDDNERMRARASAVAFGIACCASFGLSVINLVSTFTVEYDL